MIVDGMTKWACDTPHFPRDPVKFNRGDRLVQPVTGVTYTCGTSQTYLYTDFDMYTKGANTTCNAIVRTLLEQPAQERPSFLYLQLDNYTAENKNKAFFTFCGSLVAMGVLDHVQINYLCVGHTHEDIDQIFGCIRGSLKTATVLTPQAMWMLWNDCTTPSPSVRCETKMYDYLAWLAPHVNNGLSGVTKPHCVWFSMQGGEVTCLLCLLFDLPFTRW